MFSQRGRQYQILPAMELMHLLRKFCEWTIWCNLITQAGVLGGPTQLAVDVIVAKSRQSKLCRLEKRERERRADGLPIEHFTQA